jgi:cytoskeleton protein RodZ
VDAGVGPTLSAARKRRKVRLSEVEEATKIRARFLQAIENEEWDVLPGAAYTRSFIRTYADFLGLDGARLAGQHHPTQAGGGDGPRVEPDPIGPGEGLRPKYKPSRRLVTVIVCAALVGVLIAVGLSGSKDEGSSNTRSGGHASASPTPAPAERATSEKVSIDLQTTAEVWVCVLDHTGKALVEGEVLPTGVEVGPFHSDSFTVAFGNGGIAMSINGKDTEIPETPSPIGYSIDSSGELARLPESERPTCQ